MASEYYILDADKNAIPSTQLEWGRMFGDVENRRVARTLYGDVVVSTVFLGLDHNWGDGPPAIFETMIFGGAHEDWRERTSTWQEAEETHRVACSLVYETEGVPGVPG